MRKERDEILRATVIQTGITYSFVLKEDSCFKASSGWTQNHHGEWGRYEMLFFFHRQSLTLQLCATILGDINC